MSKPLIAFEVYIIHMNHRGFIINDLHFPAIEIPHM